MALIAPSILSADLLRLGAEVEMLNQSKASFIHVDVMDGVFVPNISFGLPLVQAIKKAATLPLDVHLMIIHPENYFEAFREAGADVITFHYEASVHVQRHIAQIKNLGARAGVSINPHTPVEMLLDVLPDLDFVLLMSVNPGFGGQKFIANSIERLQRLKKMIVASGSNALIEVDGGVGLQNAPMLIAAGADVLVAGNAIFNQAGPLKTISDLSAL